MPARAKVGKKRFPFYFIFQNESKKVQIRVYIWVYICGLIESEGVRPKD